MTRTILKPTKRWSYTGLLPKGESYVTFNL